MQTTRQTTNDAGPSEIVITKTVNAPLQRTRDAWTNPTVFKQWWGPEGYTCPTAKIDARVGGINLSCMRSPEGKDTWSKLTFTDVSPTRLAWIDRFSDAEGNDKRAADYAMPYWPDSCPVSVAFEEKDGKTQMTLRHGNMGKTTQKDRDDCKQGWSSTLDKLAKVVAAN